MTSHVIIVGADKGGVGKTTVSRALLDYFHTKQIEARAFDTEVPKGVLQRFHKNVTELIDLTTSDGQMKVFDTLGKSPVTLIDIRAGLLSPTLQTLSDIGMLEAVTSGVIRLTLLHIIGSSVASFQEIAGMAAILAGGKHYLVMNHLNAASFFSWNGDAREALKIGDGHIEVPKLDELAMEHVEAMNLPFSEFIENKSNSLVLRGYVRNWRARVNAQFDTMLTL